MLQAVLTYTKQRFRPTQFALLALFLLFYALGSIPVQPQHLYLFLLLLPVLYLFRLFDDLASKEVDAAKENRIYTLDAPYRQLLLFCLAFMVLVLLCFFLIKWQAGLLLCCFLLLNGISYYFLFARGQWRYVLPLLKYPFICFLLLFLTAAAPTIPAAQVLASLSLLPVFLVFEALSDPDFKVVDSVLVLLFIAAHVLLWPSLQSGYFVWPLLALAMPLLLLLLKKTAARPYLPYLTLLYFLLIRLIFSHEI